MQTISTSPSELISTPKAKCVPERSIIFKWRRWNNWPIRCDSRWNINSNISKFEKRGRLPTLSSIQWSSWWYFRSSLLWYCRKLWTLTILKLKRFVFLYFIFKSQQGFYSRNCKIFQNTNSRSCRSFRKWWPIGLATSLHHRLWKEKETRKTNSFWLGNLLQTKQVTNLYNL